jgi:hypothetical protein
MSSRHLFVGFALLTLLGCAEQRTEQNGNQPAPSGGRKTETAAQVELLQPLLLAKKPDRALSVHEAMKRKNGEVVVVTGKAPPETVKPFNTGLAAFLIMAPEELAKEAVQDELSCEDAATCPACKKILDAHALWVELVDQSGKVLTTSVEGFRDLRPGSTITVEGEVRRDGKDGKNLRILAKRFYPG